MNHRWPDKMLYMRVLNTLVCNLDPMDATIQSQTHRQRLATAIEDRFDVTVVPGGDRLEILVPRDRDVPPIIEDLGLGRHHTITVFDYLSAREVDGELYDAYQLQVTCDDHERCRYRS